MEIDIISADSLFRLGSSVIVKHTDNDGKKPNKNRDSKDSIVVTDPFGSGTYFIGNERLPPMYRNAMMHQYDSAVSYGMDQVRSSEALSLISHTHADHTRHLEDVKEAGAFITLGYNSFMEKGSWRGNGSEFKIRQAMTSHGSTSGDNLGVTSMFMVDDGDFRYVQGSDIDWSLKKDVDKVIEWNPDVALLDGPFTHRLYKMCPEATKIDPFFKPAMLDNVIAKREMHLQRAENKGNEESIERCANALSAIERYKASMEGLERIIRNIDARAVMVDHHMIRWGKGTGAMNYLSSVAEERSLNLGQRMHFGTAADLSPLPVPKYHNLTKSRGRGNKRNGFAFNTNPYTIRISDSDKNRFKTFPISK